jgi:hypothetical protein
MMKATIKNMVTGMFALLLTFGFVFEASAQYKSYGEEVVIGGDFAGDSVSSAFSTYIAGDQGASATLDASTGELVVSEITSSGAETWHIQFNQVLTADQIGGLIEGSLYELSFDAKSAGSDDVLTIFFGENGGGWTNYATSETLTSEMTTYSQTFQLVSAFTDMKLGFEMGKMAGDVTLDNISLKPVTDNVVFNGDFSYGDSTWVLSPASATIEVVDGEMVFSNIPGTGNTYDVQAMHRFSAESLDSLYAGPYQVSFDARTSEGTQEVHLFFGEVGGGWARYFPESGSGRISVDTEMKTYVLETAIETTYEVMQIGFEVNYAAGDFIFDNLVVSRITDVIPDAPEVALSTENGVVTISVTDNGAASYDVFFADSSFNAPAGGSFVATLNAENGFSTTHTTMAPHPDLVSSFDAYYGVVGRSEKGSASEMTTEMINTDMSVRENYIVELSEAAVNAVAGALESGVVPDASVLASFFPADYKPFEINSTNLRVEGSGGGTDEDISAKFWVGFETFTGGDLMVFYAEIMDDIVVPTPEASGAGGGWNFDSWEGGIGTYEPASLITGSDHQSFESGDEPDYQLRAGFMTGRAPYIMGWDGDSGTPGFNQEVGNSATIGDSSQAGMYRLLTVLSTIEFSGVNTGAKDFDFPTGTGVTTIPFQLAVNDNDGTARDAQYAWSSKSTSQWWNTPANWEVVALVGADATYSVSNEEEVVEQPANYKLEQNYPNPFNPSTTIQFSLAAAENVTLEVYNMLGQKVATLLQGERMAAGNHMQRFDASSLASGMYVYRISTPNFVQSRTMMLIK